MKAAMTILAIAGLLTPTLFFGQVEHVNPMKSDKKDNTNIFGKGMNEFTLRRDLNYSYLNDYTNDSKIGHSSDFGLNLEWNHFITDGFGIGLQLKTDASDNHTDNNFYTDIRTRDWMAFANFTYGTHLSDNFNLYGRIGVGYGSGKTIYESSTLTTTDKSNDFGFNVTVGSPFRLCHTSHTYFTPKISYNYASDKFDNGKTTDNGFSIGMNMETYLECFDFICCSHSSPLSHGMYDQGHSHIGYYSKGMIDFGNSKTTYNNLPTTNEEKNTNGHIRIDYLYNPINNFGIGASTSFMTMVNKIPNSSNKDTWNSWDFTPEVEFNLPIDNRWNNFFLHGDGGVGGETYKTETGSNSTTTKYSTSGYGFGLGYNDFFAKNMALTPMLTYDWNSSKNKTTDIKNKSQGIGFQLGIRVMF